MSTKRKNRQDFQQYGYLENKRDRAGILRVINEIEPDNSRNEKRGLRAHTELQIKPKNDRNY